MRIGRKMRLAAMYVKLYPGLRPAEVARAVGSNQANGYRTVASCERAGMIQRKYTGRRISLYVREGRGIQ